MKLKYSLEGRYNLIVRDGKTLDVKRETGWFNNLITDTGLNRLGTGTPSNHALVGSGSAAPSVSDTTMNSFVAATTTLASTIVNGVQATEPYFGWTRKTYRFAAGVAAGNLSEVGVGWGPAAVFSRALIRDPEGDPTTITVLSDEVLDVVYELRMYPNLTDQEFELVIGGVTHECLMRAAIVTTAAAWQPLYLLNNGAVPVDSPVYSAYAYTGAIGTILQAPSGVFIGQDNGSNLTTYSNNSLKRTVTCYFDLGAGNHGSGIMSLMLQQGYLALGTYQIQFTPPIAKDATKIFNITFEMSWARKT